MPIPADPNLLLLITDATLKSFWRRQTLRDFVRRCGVSASFIATWTTEETKRDFLARLFPALEKASSGATLISRMANTLAEQTSFPDLTGWDDSADKKRQAVDAVKALKEYLDRSRKTISDEKEREAARKRLREMQESAREQRETLAKLEERLNELSKRLGDQKAGYDFQDWYYDLLAFYEVPTRRPYVTSGRQIDGSVTILGTTYLNELKFTSDQVGAPDIDIFHKKVSDKADNTMGIFVSISGYSPIAIDAASGRRRRCYSWTTPICIFFCVGQ